ncbi:cohesin subunit SA-1-like [Periplaneta americana]|uniref:cohesin subunit SA-1-like n=1 Tax=Periplaneta americana TaxID=6978 RepID=UPI0037E7703F
MEYTDSSRQHTDSQTLNSPSMTSSPASSLICAVMKSRGVSSQRAVDEWVRSYKANQDSALLALTQFFITVSGCKGEVTSAMQTTMEHTAIIKKMTEEFGDESGEYPLVKTSRNWKNFRKNFSNLLQVLIKKCQNSIIYDQYLMDNVTSLLTAMSDSEVRAFRHTSTFAVLKLMTALVDVAITVSGNLENAKRQYEAEMGKERENRAIARLEVLKSTQCEMEENMEELHNILTFMFQAVFAQRYRDIAPEIRAICMEEIGMWIYKFPQHFLADSYLKYIGWTLYDEVQMVRLACIKTLQPLYACENFKNELQLFTIKFKSAIIALTKGNECDVAVEAIHLIISIFKYQNHALTDDDCELMYEHIFSPRRVVAKAAGEFLKERLSLPSERNVAEAQYKRRKKYRSNTPLIRDLVLFFIESELPEHATYLVDALIDSNEMVKDWECMTDLLMEEPESAEEAMSDQEESSLIEIMTCCIRQTVTGEPPEGRIPAKKVMSATDLKRMKMDKLRLTEHFMRALPSMLSKYEADPDKVANLLLIPQYLELNMYITSRQEMNLNLLLEKIAKIAEKHNNEVVLETCAKTLNLLCKEQTIATSCTAVRSTLLCKIVTKYKKQMDEWRAVTENEEIPEEDMASDMVCSLKKIASFYKFQNLGDFGIWNYLFQLITEAKNGCEAVPAEGVEHCISACFTAILWDLNHLENITEAGVNISGELQELRTRLHMYMDAMKEILGGNIRNCMESAYRSVCYLLLAFSENLGSKVQLSELVYEVDFGLELQLIDFVQQYVFTAADIGDNQFHTQIAASRKRRNLLASFCRLITCNSLSIRAAAEVFKHYVKYYNEYGDILKATMRLIREGNKTKGAVTMLMSLTLVYQNLEKNQTQINRQCGNFIYLKELAKRFALLFGVDARKNRKALMTLHHHGIVFSVKYTESQRESFRYEFEPPPNLSFLEFLTEFSYKLTKEDRKLILTSLDKCFKNYTPIIDNEDWQPLFVYRNSLIHGKTVRQRAANKKTTGSQKRRKYHDEELEEVEASDKAEEEEEEEVETDDEVKVEEEQDEVESPKSAKDLHSKRKKTGKRPLAESSPKKEENQPPSRKSKLGDKIRKGRESGSQKRSRTLTPSPELESQSTSLSSILSSDASGQSKKRRRSFLTSTCMYGENDQPSFLMNKSAISGVSEESG